MPDPADVVPVGIATRTLVAGIGPWASGYITSRAVVLCRSREHHGLGTEGPGTREQERERGPKGPRERKSTCSKQARERVFLA